MSFEADFGLNELYHLERIHARDRRRSTRLNSERALEGRRRLRIYHCFRELSCASSIPRQATEP
jgi:hypothetical protein